MSVELEFSTAKWLYASTPARCGVFARLKSDRTLASTVAFCSPDDAFEILRRRGSDRSRFVLLRRPGD